jgi:hypothetical protein
MLKLTNINYQNPVRQTDPLLSKTLNQIIFFPPPKSEYFFQQHWESEYFFRKNHNPPPPSFKLNGSSLTYSLNIKLGQLCKQVKDNICNSFLVLYLPVSIFNEWARTLILHIDCRIFKLLICKYFSFPKLLTYVQILDTWTHQQNLSGYLLMNMNKFWKN